MTEKDLKRIRRKDLKEMLVFQSEKAERLQQRINEFESKEAHTVQSRENDVIQNTSDELQDRIAFIYKQLKKIESLFDRILKSNEK